MGRGTSGSDERPMRRMKDRALRWWGVLRSPSRYYSLGFLTIGGFLGGILFWGGFNTALEATNTEQFCTS